MCICRFVLFLGVVGFSCVFGWSGFVFCGICEFRLLDCLVLVDVLWGGLVRFRELLCELCLGVYLWSFLGYVI